MPCIEPSELEDDQETRNERITTEPNCKFVDQNSASHLMKKVWWWYDRAKHYRHIELHSDPECISDINQQLWNYLELNAQRECDDQQKGPSIEIGSDDLQRRRDFEAKYRAHRFLRVTCLITFIELRKSNNTWGSIFRASRSKILCLDAIQFGSLLQNWGRADDGRGCQETGNLIIVPLKMEKKAAEHVWYVW
jgi:hypothetical protein